LPESFVAEWAAPHRFELHRNWTLPATKGKFLRARLESNAAV